MGPALEAVISVVVPAGPSYGGACTEGSPCPEAQSGRQAPSPLPASEPLGRRGGHLLSGPADQALGVTGP